MYISLKFGYDIRMTPINNVVAMATVSSICNSTLLCSYIGICINVSDFLCAIMNG